VGYKHSRDDILDAAVALATTDGLSALSFGRVAQSVGTSDRVVVYYFPSKDDLVAAVLGALGERLRSALAPGLHAAADHLELVRAAWPVLAHPAADPVFALFFEAAGLAASGREPYRSVVPALVDGWIEWTSTYVVGGARRRRAAAEAAVAVLDGLLLLRHVAGAAAAEREARALGVSSGARRSGEGA
jgi:AcrR family transcriptional regulator